MNEQTANAAFVQVGGYLTDDWANGKDQAAKFMGPQMPILRR